MPSAIPPHVAIIMDGNGRWARSRCQPRLMGHRAGRKVVRQLIQWAVHSEIKILTLFAFGQENWRRPEREVKTLMQILIESFDLFLQELHDNSIRLSFIGDRDTLSERIVKKIVDAEQATAHYQRLHLVIAFNYSGRWDITQASQQLARKVAAGELSCDALDESTLAKHLVTADLPDPDLLIRTGGAQRFSNFLLWQLSYAECYFLDIFWPDFDQQHWQQALAFYAAQERRFGMTSEQVKDLNHA